MKIIIDIPEKTFKYYVTLANKGEQIGSLERIILDGTPLPKCNECKYYKGVHKVQGHAPCSYHTIGGVMWDWYCLQFEADKGE